MADCRDLVKRISNLKETEVDSILDEIENVINVKTQAGKIDEIDQAVRDVTERIVKDIEIAKLMRKRDLYRNILIENKMLDMMETADKKTGQPGKGIAAMLGGLNDRFKGAMNAIDFAIQGHHRSAMGPFIDQISKAGLLQDFRHMKGDFEREVARALAELNGAKNVGQYSDKAKQLAGFMHEAQEKMRRRKNLFGGFVQRKKGYIVRQTHDRLKLAKLGREEWKATIRDKLDYEKMGVPRDEIDRFLDSAYGAISTGIRRQKHKNGTDVVDKNLDVTDSIFSYAGPGNLAKKLSQHRLLEFKSPDDWYEYDQKFGNKSLGASFSEDMRSSARDIALMQYLGTNPEAMLKRLIKRGQEKYRDDDKKLKSFKPKHYENILKELTGEVDIPANETAATWGRRIRALQTMSKLGGSVISAFSDMAAFAATRQFQGRSFFESWMDAFQAPLKGLMPGEANAYLRSVGIGVDGLLGDFTARFSSGDEIQGQTSKMMQLYFKANLLQPWTDANKRAIGQMLSNDFATEGNIPFNQLTPERQNLFSIYGIDAERWDVIRASAGKAEDGNMYIQPGLIKVPETGRFKKMSDASKERYVEESKQMITSLFLNEADVAVPTPGARERAILRMGYPPGSGAGEAFRYMFQFKSFSVTIMTKVLQRQTRGYGANGILDSKFYSSRGMVGLAGFIATSSALGLVSYQAKQMLKGREPRELNAKTIMAGMLQGGGAGIYGDFLFAEYNRFGGGFVQTLAGPTVGSIGGLIDLINKTTTLSAEGDFEFSKVGPEGVNLLKSNTPFMNLFYTKQAMDYLIWHQLQELMRPGYLKRHERTLENQYDQKYFLPPSSIIKRGGGFE
jgi:hypothetical protein